MVAAWQPVHSGARCPRPSVPRCAFSRAPRASFGAWFACAGVLVTVARAGRAGGALCWTSAHVLVINIDAGSGRSHSRKRVYSSGAKNALGPLKNVLQEQGECNTRRFLHFKNVLDTSRTFFSCTLTRNHSSCAKSVLEVHKRS